MHTTENPTPTVDERLDEATGLLDAGKGRDCRRILNAITLNDLHPRGSDVEAGAARISRHSALERGARGVK